MTSILDTDLYKLTTQHAVLKTYSRTASRYKLIFRRPVKFNDDFKRYFRLSLADMAGIKLTPIEADWVGDTLGWVDSLYLAYLKNYRFDPSQVHWDIDDQGNFNLEIVGPWEETVLWEVPLMAMISEGYFKYCDTDWDQVHLQNNTLQKIGALHSLNYSEFGTRRRRSYDIQKLVLTMLDASSPESGYAGTSNVHFSQHFGSKPLGTMPHEWIMGSSAMVGLRAANNSALMQWAELYPDEDLIGLPDTFGTSAFLSLASISLFKIYGGFRQDSGDPKFFGESFIKVYEKLDIDPRFKTLSFSDDLNPEKCQDIAAYFKGRIGARFGIGTNFTNDFQKDFPKSPPLNMVIKMTECDRHPVVKLSDDRHKACGDPSALRVANWTLYGDAL